MATTAPGGTKAPAQREVAGHNRAFSHCDIALDRRPKYDDIAFGNKIVPNRDRSVDDVALPDLGVFSEIDPRAFERVKRCPALNPSAPADHDEGALVGSNGGTLADGACVAKPNIPDDTNKWSNHGSAANLGFDQGGMPGGDRTRSDAFKLGIRLESLTDAVLRFPTAWADDEGMRREPDVVKEAIEIGNGRHRRVSVVRFVRRELFRHFDAAFDVNKREDLVMHPEKGDDRVWADAPLSRQSERQPGRYLSWRADPRHLPGEGSWQIHVDTLGCG